MELILIRHGQSESNARLTTELDASLTQLGTQQAQATAEHLVKNVFDPSKSQIILVSPFKRTLQTCYPLVTISSHNAEVYPLMCEYFCSEIPAYSSFIGLDQTLISTHFPAIQCPIDQPLQSKWWPNKTEDIADMYARMRIAAEDLYSKYASDSIQVIIYSHAEPIGRLIEVLRKDAFNPGWPPWTENCGINRLQIHNLDEPADVTVLNDTEHLAKVGLISPIYQ